MKYLFFILLFSLSSCVTKYYVIVMQEKAIENEKNKISTPNVLPKYWREWYGDSHIDNMPFLSDSAWIKGFQKTLEYRAPNIRMLGDTSNRIIIGL